MHGKYRESRAGFTLVEVLVVLAIVALVSAIAIPGLAKLGAFSRDEFKRATQETYSILRAAQLYATTYNVNTAVVYSMDNYSPAEAATGTLEAPVNPITDSFTGQIVRQFEAVSIMYQLPTSMPNLLNGNPNPLKGCYVPISGELGEFRLLPEGMSILLYNPEDLDVSDPMNPVYREYYKDENASNLSASAAINQLWRLGIGTIEFASGVPEALPALELDNFLSTPTNIVKANFPAHVFKPSGRLTASTDIERISLYIAPSSDRPLEERLVQPEIPDLLYTDSDGVVRSNLRYREIHLFKSTGRIAVPQDF